MSKKHKWILFYVKVSHIAANVYPEIKYKDFDDELDLLVWASEMHIPKQIGMHWIMYQDEITRLPVDLYERIDYLTKKRAEAEAAKETVEVIESKPHKRGRPKKEEVCIQS
jgi:transposase